ncbi:SPOR domain-containing protein [Palleronia sediminis]|uniref:SPOR domain-containing protein n=1 Tax=Palleronia sediminis TaxID=2547833 RepID=A0A4R6AE96_9RHOB|nr:SPOR domain-containing protein [Palleronia sediminis]TDL81274.1 SPOR domain-containing protein [Palleronia sediminis]
MDSRFISATGLALGAALALSGCQTGPLAGLQDRLGQDGEDAAPTEIGARLVERDVEAPEIFQVTERGLWDGRPSLGGVWVAHPSVDEPERVIIRNSDNDKFVIGALFRRERDNPGPSLQVSSDAADALGMLAGAPALLNVTALRRKEAEAEAPAPVPAADTLAPEAPVTTASLETPEAAPAPAPAPASSLDRPYVQIGIFSVEQNAQNTATALRGAGVVPRVETQESQNKVFYRVIVGPAATAADRNAVLAKVKALGFADAYFVSG